MSSKDLSIIIKTQKAFIKELLKMLVDKDKCDVYFRTFEEKLGKVCSRYFKKPKNLFDEECMYINIDKEYYSVKELKNLLNKDDYFKGFTFEQILMLAKNSIRLTTENCELRHKLEEKENE